MRLNYLGHLVKRLSSTASLSLTEMQNRWKIKHCKNNPTCHLNWSEWLQNHLNGSIKCFKDNLNSSKWSETQVLESDEFEDISLELMKKIIRRDTLALNSELIVWHAVARSLYFEKTIKFWTSFKKVARSLHFSKERSF